MFNLSVVSKSLQPHGLQPARILYTWGFSRSEYWSGQLFPSPWDLYNPRIGPRSLTLWASILWCSSFFMVKLSHPTGLLDSHDYWRNHRFDQKDFVGKVVSLLFNTLSRYVTDFLPRSKRDDLIQNPTSSRYSSIGISYPWSVSSLLFKYFQMR